MNRVILVGAGSLGVQLAHQVRLAGGEVVGFFDDVHPVGSIIGGFGPVLGPIPAKGEKKTSDHCQLVMAIGYDHLHRRLQLFSHLKDSGFHFLTLVHATAWVDPTAILEEGVVLYPGCIVDRNVHIGANVLLNNGCIVSHDSSVGEGSFLAPGVVISGNCRIGRRNFLGTGTLVRDGVSTVADCRFGMGSLVVSDAIEAGSYTGHPSKRMRS